MSPKKNVAYVAVGSNQGDSWKIITRAFRLLHLHSKIKVEKISALYETKAVGGPRQRNFLNCVVKIRTTLVPRELLRVLQFIEKVNGRKRDVRWGPRTLDLDLNTYNDQKLKTKDLTLPHPRFHLRRFVLVPFSELAPSYFHPRLKKQNRELLAQLTLSGQRVTMVGQWKKSRFYPFKRRKKKKSRSQL